MILIGIARTLFAFSTVSPNLSEQFSLLVDLSVVTVEVTEHLPPELTDQLADQLPIHWLP